MEKCNELGSQEKIKEGQCTIKLAISQFRSENNVKLGKAQQ